VRRAIPKKVNSAACRHKGERQLTLPDGHLSHILGRENMGLGIKAPGKALIVLLFDARAETATASPGRKETCRRGPGTSAFLLVGFVSGLMTYCRISISMLSCIGMEIFTENWRAPIIQQSSARVRGGDSG
jgi:hypothetical protein